MKFYIRNTYMVFGKRLSKSLKVKVNFNEIENCKNNNKPGKF